MSRYSINSNVIPRIFIWCVGDCCGVF